MAALTFLRDVLPSCGVKIWGIAASALQQLQKSMKRA
jgi:hypothetical protein